MLTIAVIIGLTSIKHPIILKWITGSARLIGNSTNARIYTNEQLNAYSKVYKVNTYWNGKKANYYLLYFIDAETKEMTTVISLNIQDNYVGKSVSTNKNDYDIVWGQLFQSEVGAHFSSFKNDMKGYDFDPKLTLSDKEITLNVPRQLFKCDSIKVVF